MCRSSRKRGRRRMLCPSWCPGAVVVYGPQGSSHHDDIGVLRRRRYAMRLHAAPPARGLVPMLTLATFVNHLNVIAWNPFLPFIAAELGVPVALLGQVPALMMLLATSLGLVIGPLGDHYGYRRTLLLCLLAVVTSSLVTGLAATLRLLILAALVVAVGSVPSCRSHLPVCRTPVLTLP